MWKGIAANALTMLIVLMIAAAALVAWGRNQYVSPGPLTASVCLRVESGARMASVSRNLEELGAVSSARIFRIGVEYSGRAPQLKAGSHLIEAGASMEEVLDTITRSGAQTCGAEVILRIGVTASDVLLRELDPGTGVSTELAKYVPGVDPVPEAMAAALADTGMRFRVTVAEGATSWQIVEGLKMASFLDGTVAAVPAEGSLAPESYDVTRGADRAELLERMTNRQSAILNELWPGRDADLPYDTPEQAMIMASIIEKETGVPNERGQVASVFVNRLRQGMRLQTDPTVIYGITKGEGTLGRGLRQSELRRETPYNTYVINGLPPGPIANPGRASIAAALHPDQTDLIYFVADGTGGHAFARTLEEHNQNVTAWRAIEAERAAQGGGN